MELNICYIVGTILLYKNQISFDDLEKIGNKLFDKGYKVDTSKENIFAMFSEWKDFFMLDLDNNILLTESAKKNKRTVKIIFNSVLDPTITNDIFKSFLDRNKQKSKIIKFQ